MQFHDNPMQINKRGGEMKNIKQTVSVALVIALASLGTIALAQSQRPYRMTDRAVQQLIQRIENRADRYQLSLKSALDFSQLDNTRREDNINQFVTDFEQATNQLRDRFNRRESTMSDVQTVLSRAVPIERFMSRFILSNNAERDWILLKSELNRLARYYRVAWNWNNPPFDNYSVNTRLTGTYRMIQSRSDNARVAVERAVRSLPVAQRQRAYDAVIRRIEPPEMLALERRGLTVSIASSRAPQTTFEADGREHLEQYPNSRVTSRVRAVLSGDQLLISSTGDRATDYSVTFDPIYNGRQLRVTRRLYAERLTQPVVVQTTYDKTSDLAQWSFTSTPDYRNVGPLRAEFVIPDGTMLVTRLNTDIDSTRTRVGAPFALTVLSPSQFQGAIIDGYVSNVDRGGRVTGRTEVALNLERIRLTNGEAHPFEGLIESVRTTNGETVRVDTEGTVRENKSQSERTIERTAIGTAIGAIIGAIAGGGKGAAVGALVGAGAGAGSIYVQGRNDLELISGTEITVRAVAPRTSARR